MSSTMKQHFYAKLKNEIKNDLCRKPMRINSEVCHVRTAGRWQIRSLEEMSWSSPATTGQIGEGELQNGFGHSSISVPRRPCYLLTFHICRMFTDFRLDWLPSAFFWWFPVFRRNSGRSDFTFISSFIFVNLETMENSQVLKTAHLFCAFKAHPIFSGYLEISHIQSNSHHIVNNMKICWSLPIKLYFQTPSVPSPQFPNYLKSEFQTMFFWTECVR